MPAYYNENDPKAAAWLRELIKAGHIAPGHVDERSITDVRADDLRGFEQCHFFAGIGGWSLALRLAGWPDSRPAWTGSCPCQPFSAAGQQKGEEDERHLWPVLSNLIRAGQPPVCFGEQTFSALGRQWLAGVFADLEGMGYRPAAADLCAASCGAPHIRQRLFWVAYASSSRIGAGLCNNGSAGQRRDVAANGGGFSGMVDTFQSRLEGHAGDGDHSDQSRRLGAKEARPASATGGACNEWMGNPKSIGRPGRENNEDGGRRELSLGHSGAWSNFDILPCLDGKARRIESGTFPLAHGVPGRVGLLRGYGNAINPWVAKEFIQASEEAIRELAER